MPTSRMPSTKVLLWPSKPRMKGRSPVGLPPSPAPKVMPGTMRRASCRLVAPVSCSSCPVTIDTVLGVSSSSAVNLGEDGLNQLPRTCTESSSVAAGCGAEAAAGPASSARAAQGARPAARVAVAVASTVACGGCLRLRMWLEGVRRRGRGEFIEGGPLTCGWGAWDRGGLGLLPRGCAMTGQRAWRCAGGVPVVGHSAFRPVAVPGRGVASGDRLRGWNRWWYRCRSGRAAVRPGPGADRPGRRLPRSFRPAARPHHQCPGSPARRPRGRCWWPASGVGQARRPRPVRSAAHRPWPGTAPATASRPARSGAVAVGLRDGRIRAARSGTRAEPAGLARTADHTK